MIEVVSSDRCVQCGLCVKVCPTNVFDTREDGVPVIARQEDCQTCFICEAYCPVDALYVSPYAEQAVACDEEALAVAGALGSWRATIGWGRGRTTLAAIDTTPFIDRILPPRPAVPERKSG
ncbi:4Fe-4S binding protein [Paenibacillus aurantiacus]|uniref:4Fe-4S binding protein n=1 Tax=Paenibacillus aurantiacus TaxID=1936118 RepID=A0ABV5KM80_9BACL